MRNAISTALLLLMLFRTAGHLFVFEAQQYKIRQEIKRQIKAGVPKEELVLLKIAEFDPAFQSLHAREFRYLGQMYDVVRQEAHGDTTWYYCLSDEQETQLFANLDKSVKRDMSQNPERQQQLGRLLLLLGSLFFPPLGDNSLHYAAEAVELTADLFKLKTWIGAPNTPPPEA